MVDSRATIAQFMNHIVIRWLDDRYTLKQKEFKIRDLHWSFDYSTFEISREEALEKAYEEGQVLVQALFNHGSNLWTARERIKNFSDKLIMYAWGHETAESVQRERDYIIEHATNAYGYDYPCTHWLL